MKNVRFFLKYRNRQKKLLLFSQIEYIIAYTNTIFTQKANTTYENTKI